MEKKKYCPSCDRRVSTRVDSRKETFKVRGENTTIQSSVLVCEECKQDIFDDELDGKNIELVYNEYRKKHKLLFPSEISEIREKYGLSQRALSRFLEWGEVTINRYETGALQDKVHDQVLRLVSDPKNMYKLYENQKDLLSIKESEKLEQRLDSLLKYPELSFAPIERAREREFEYTEFYPPPIERAIEKKYSLMTS